MAYATQADMVKKYSEQQLVELTDRAEELTGEIDGDILSAALDDASALIDSYLRRRYALPLSPVPAVLRNVCATVAYYELHRGRYADETRKAYDDVMGYLSQLSAGTVVLDVAGTEPTSAPAQAVADMVDRRFSRKKGEW